MRKSASVFILSIFATSFFLNALMPFVMPQMAFAEEVESVVEEVPLTEVPETIEEPVVLEETVVSSSTESEIATSTEETILDEEFLSTLATPMPDSMLEAKDAKVTLHVRYNNDLLFDGEVTLSTTTVNVIDSSLVTRSVAGSSTLAALVLADSKTDTFDISTLTYYDSFDSFIVSCMNLKNVTVGTTTTSLNACNDWQFVVNDQYPYVGMDDQILNDGDDIYVYFGTKSRVELPATTTYTTQPFDVVAQKYEYQTNTWSPMSPVTIGVTQPNPLDPWSPLILATSSTRADGHASFTLNATGTYGVGIAEEYYFPLYNLEVFDIKEMPAPATTTPTSTPSGEGTGSGGGVTSSFSLPNAVSFIKSNENGGRYGAGLYADWAAIGLTSYGSVSTDLRNYIISSSISGTNISDYARRSMSLMSMGVNPYDGTAKNYIQEITKGFDGLQFGEAGLINDDIFAILVLSKAGYGISDTEISKSISYVLARQSSSGAFDSVDVTAAAIQILVQYQADPQVSAAILKAKQYLKDTQDNEGGWQNTSATTWVMQAIAALGETNEQWVKNGKTPMNFLASKQATDGGVDSSMDVNSRVWATSYAVPAYLAKPWTSILQSFSKQTVKVGGGTGSPEGSSYGLIASTTATITSTSTIAVESNTASTTPEAVIPELRAAPLPFFDEEPQLPARAALTDNMTGKTPVFATASNAQSTTTQSVATTSTSTPTVSPNSQVASTAGLLDFLKNNPVAMTLTGIMLLSLLGLSYLGYNKVRNN